MRKLLYSYVGTINKVVYFQFGMKTHYHCRARQAPKTKALNRKYLLYNSSVIYKVFCSTPFQTAMNFVLGIRVIPKTHLRRYTEGLCTLGILVD